MTTRGRPKLPEGKGKTAKVNIRLPIGEYQAAQTAAAQAGLSLSDYIREAMRPGKETKEPPRYTSWNYHEEGGAVQIVTTQPLPLILWQRLTRYVEMLEPPEPTP